MYGSGVGFQRANLTVTVRNLNSPPSSSVSSEILVQNQWERTGTTTPLFGKIQRSGAFLPSNSYTYTKTQTGRFRGMIYEQVGLDSNPTKNVSTTLIGPRDPEVFFITSDSADNLTASQLASIDSVALQKLHDAIKAQKVNLVQAYAERARTARTITELIGNVAKCISAFRKGRLGDAAEAIGVHIGKRARRKFLRGTQHPSRLSEQEASLARGWLALQYGIKPILNDIYGLLDELKEPLPRSGAYATGSAARSVSTQVTHVRNSPNTSSHGATYMKSGEHRYLVKYSCVFTYAVPELQSLSRLGITNPLYIAWELMPYSFVFDWFLPIGGWLNSFDSTLGLTFVSGSKTEFSQNRCAHISVQPGIDYQNRRARWNSSKEYRKVTVVRTKLTSFPASKFPDFKNPFSWSHVASALSLLSTAVHGTNRRR